MSITCVCVTFCARVCSGNNKMEALRYFLPGHCYEEVLVKLNVFDGEGEGNSRVVLHVLFRN